MADSRLFETVRTFSPEEQKSFELFLKSPFFVPEEMTEELLGLYRGLCNQMAYHADLKLNKQDLHTAGFPGKSYSGPRLDKALARLGQLAEQFLLHNHQKENSNKLQQELQLAGIFRRRNAYAYSEKKNREAHKLAEQYIEESQESYLLRYQLAFEDYEWQALVNQGNGSLNIPTTLHHLKLYYNAMCAKLTTHLAMQQLTSAERIPDIERLMSDFGIQRDAYSQDYPLFQIYATLQELLLREKADTQEFYALMALIKENEAKISTFFHRDLYTYLRNYCALLINQGVPGMHEVMHQIHLDNLKRGYLYFHGRIPPHVLLNITRVGLMVKNFAAVREIIEAHRDKIQSAHEQEEIYKINLAHYFFAEGKFEEAEQYLAFPKHTFQYLVIARRLEVMIHYELKTDLLPYKINAFRKFIERTASREISTITRKQCLNFANFVLQLSQSMVKDPKRSQLVLKRLSGHAYIADRTWLLEKAKELG